MSNAGWGRRAAMVAGTVAAAECCGGASEPSDHSGSDICLARRSAGEQPFRGIAIQSRAAVVGMGTVVVASSASCFCRAEQLRLEPGAADPDDWRVGDP